MEAFYKDKSVLVTGHTGFKGSWLVHWLSLMGAKVTGIANSVPTEPANFITSQLADLVRDIWLDVRNMDELGRAIRDVEPDIVFHLAAQSLVRPSYEYPLETISTNAMGTANILESLRNSNKPVTAVLITSDKAYDNVEWVWGYRETDALGGKDIYSASKGMAELAIKCYLESFYRDKECKVRLAVARAGNVIGGGDWATDRIVPDCMRAWSENRNVDIRNPAATRPWQHVLEPLSGYLSLACELSARSELHGEAFNLGPPSKQDQSVRDLITEMARHWDNISWNDISGQSGKLHEAGLLKLNCDKALAMLGWMPTLDFSRTVEMTVSWYGMFYQEKPTSMQDFSRDQILQYCTLAREQGMGWAND